MFSLSDLYQLYPNRPEKSEMLKAQEVLAPYADQFKLTLTNGNLKIGTIEGMLNTLSLSRIHAIIDEPDYVYIVLHASIYILCKKDNEVKIHIKQASL